MFTTPILAMFYYFLPKSTGLPIFSHRLSIVAFWSLIFAYMWTGAHHLVYTPLPDWIQTLAIVFTLFLIAPSWGSVVNGYYTVGQDWSKMRTNYLTKFFVLGITFYGLQTVQGPTQALRVVSQLIHFTDWVPGHVHMGTMGWVTMVICALDLLRRPEDLRDRDPLGEARERALLARARRPAPLLDHDVDHRHPAGLDVEGDRRGGQARLPQLRGHRRGELSRTGTRARSPGSSSPSAWCCSSTTSS